MSEVDYLVGVEEYELAFVEDVLDDAPVDSQTVYKETIAMSERAIAAVAAKRAGEGGGGSPHGLEGLESTEVTTIAGSSGTDLLPVQHFYGDVLMDCTDPTLPVFLESGVYAVMISVVPAVTLTDGSYRVLLEMDPVGSLSPGVFLPVTSSVSALGEGKPPISITGVYYFPATTGFSVEVENNDSQSNDFSFSTVAVQQVG